jgi:hypothetical protein
MLLVHVAVLVTSLALGVAGIACGNDAPRMRVATSHVRAGESIVVRFVVPPAARRCVADARARDCERRFLGANAVSSRRSARLGDRVFLFLRAR